tara:strand:- start:8456 stop:9934 length:1479 start_codon:yes stop_codon:yes gene_type:complete
MLGSSFSLKLSRFYFKFLTFQFLHLILLLIVKDISESGLVLIISGITNIIIYTFFLINRITKYVNIVNPLNFYLVASIIRLGIGVIYTGFVFISDFDEFLGIGYNDISDDIINGHILLILGDIMFIIGYSFFQNNSLNKSLKKSNYFFSGLLLASFALVTKFLEFDLGRFILYFTNFGMASGIYIMGKSLINTNPRKFLFRYILTILMFIFSVFISLFSYMKSDLLISFLPVVFLLLELYKDKKFKLSTLSILKISMPMLIITYFAVITITIYSGLRRSYIGINNTEVSNARSVEVSPFLKTALVASIPGTKEFNQFNQFPNLGFWHFVKRNSVTNLGAWAYNEVDESGYWERNFFNYLFGSMIPRIFWPEKPQYWPGREFAVKTGQAKSPELATTSTALTMAGAYYWWGGYFALIFGMLFSGAFLSIIFRKIENKLHNPIAVMISFILIFQSLKWFEGSFMGSIPLFVYIIIVFSPLIYLYDLIIRKTDKY